MPFYELDNTPNAARTTGVRNADKTWRYSTAAADKTYAYAYASAAALKAQAGEGKGSGKAPVKAGGE